MSQERRRLDAEIARAAQAIAKDQGKAIPSYQWCVERARHYLAQSSPAMTTPAIAEAIAKEARPC